MRKIIGMVAVWGALVVPPVLLGGAVLTAPKASATPVDQGAPGRQGPWPTTPGVCSKALHKVTTVGTSSTSCPSTALAGRRYVRICNSSRNTAGQRVTIRIDGVAPTTAASSPGDVLEVGDCVEYFVPATITPLCISDAAGTYLTSLECI